jgi:hypothetical protein
MGLFDNISSALGTDGGGGGVLGGISSALGTDKSSGWGAQIANNPIAQAAAAYYGLDALGAFGSAAGATGADFSLGGALPNAGGAVAGWGQGTAIAGLDAAGSVADATALGGASAALAGGGGAGGSAMAADALGAAGALGGTGAASATPSMFSLGGGALPSAGGGAAAFGATPSASFLPVTGAGPGLSTLDATTAANLGIDTSGVGAVGGATPSGSFLSGLGDKAMGAVGDAGHAISGALGKVGSGIMNNPLQSAGLALMARNVLGGPQQLPSYAQQAGNTATDLQTQANGILQSGGTSSPMWNGMKASIDSSIDGNLKNAIEQLKQSAANSGQGGDNSAVVQQGINNLTQQAETQRQAQYTQALSSITNQAVSMLTGGNQTLTSLAQMQMANNSQAQASAGQIGEMAALIGTKA